MSTLVTGASGFLGQEILEEIKKRKNESFILLLREESFKKYSEILKEFPHVKLAKGHLQHPDLFIDTRELEKAKDEVTNVIHLAALYDLKASKERLYKTNVIGTQNVIFFCQEAKNLKKLLYASTIAVAGNVDGPYTNQDYDLGQEHPNPYAKTKFEAEGLVRKFSNNNKKIQIDIIRLGVIVGHSKTGAFLKEDGPYYFFKNIGRVLNNVPILTKLSVVPFPFEGDAIFPIVPVDCAAQAFWKQYDEDHEGLKCQYAIAENAPSMKSFLEDFLIELKMPMKVIPLPSTKIGQGLLKKGLGAIQIPEALTDYLYLKTKFINISSEAEPDDSVCSYSQFKRPFFDAVIKKYLPRVAR